MSLITELTNAQVAAFSGMNFVSVDEAVQNGLRSMNLRHDAGETATFSRQLEQIMTEVIMTEFVDSKFRSFLPVSGEVSNAVPLFTYRQYEGFGKAVPISDQATADDIPVVDVQGAEFSFTCKSFATAYAWTLQEMRQSAYTGLPLDNMRAMTARQVMEQKFDALAAVGGNGFATGFANASNILAQTKGTQKTGTTWQDASGNIIARPEEILADVHGMCRNVFDTTKGRHTANALLLDTKGYSLLSAKPQSPAFTDASLMTYILRMSPWIKSIDFWPQLDTAGSGGKARIMAYDKSPSVVKCMIPQEYEQIPPQAHGLGFKVIAHARFGGVCVYKPKAICYMDGTEP